MNNKFNKIIVAILLAQGVAMTATAADKVKISPVISAGEGGFSANASSNVWFTLDDSGSMGAMGTGLYRKEVCKKKWFSKYNPRRECIRDYYSQRWCTIQRKVCRKELGKSYTGRLTLGYLPYDENITYQVPVSYDGEKLPLPADKSLTYKIGPSQGQKKNTATGGSGNHSDSLYSDIFITYARDKLGFTASNQADPGKGDYSGYANKTWDEIKKHPTIKITDTARVIDENEPRAFYYSTVEDDKSCEKADKKKNCQIWKTYYSSRMLALKSSLSLALFKHKDADYRFGFQSLWHQGVLWDLSNMDDFDMAKNGSSRWGIWGGRKTRMDERVSLLPLKTNNKENRKILYRWLFTLIPESGTPTRGVVSHLLYELKKKEHGGSPTGSIYRKDPSKVGKYDAENNPAVTCRKNHHVILTDGQWETYNKHATEYAIKEKMEDYKTQYGDNAFNSLPDGKAYLAKSRFRASPLIRRVGVMGLSDMAFQAWASDLDDNIGNNKEGQDGAVVTQYREYLGKDGKPKLYKDGGDAYWHHFNDPATWQHINTHTIGFGLDESHYGEVHINPPLSSEDAKKLTSNFRWKRSTTSDLVSSYSGYEKSYRIPKNLAQGDLARAAIAGRGLYANAKSGQDLIDIFDRIMASLRDDIDPVPSTAGSAGVAGSSQTAGNSYFSSRYDSKAFTGELIKYNFFSGSSSDEDEQRACFGKTFDPRDARNNPLPKAGTVCPMPAKSGSSEWNVAKLLRDKDWEERKIITRTKVKDKNKVEKHQVVDFKVDNLHKDQKKVLKDNFTTVISGNFSDNKTRLKALIDYVRGDSKHEGKFRSRDKHEYSKSDKSRNILGAIMRSSPVYVGVPNAYTAHLSKNSDAYNKYIKLLEKYIEDNKDGKKEMIFVGANDGMLHAFNANTGQEEFAYIPAAVYEKLPQTVESGKKVSLVDGNMDVQLVNFGTAPLSDDSNSDWQRVLVGGMGGGAKGLYSLNITASDSGTPTAASVKKAKKGNWEITAKQSKNVGNILAKPAIIQLADNTWAAVVGNGYNSENNKAVLLVINLESGKIIQELIMPEKKGSTTFSDGNKANGLAPVRFLRYPSKARNKSNHYDRAYAGDLQGNLWVFDLTKSSKSGGITVVNEQPLFTATDKDRNRQPITVAPLAVKHPWGYGTLIHFGTGALFDVDDLSTKVTNSIYAIWDDWIPAKNSGLPTPRDTTVMQTDLNKVHMKEITVNKKEVRYLDTAKNKNTTWRLEGKATGTYRGWKVDLKKGERAWQSATITYGAGNFEAISYNLVKYKDSAVANACGGSTGSVQNIEMAFNPDDAAQFLPSSGALDIDEDGNFSASDEVTVDVTVKNSDGTTKEVKKAVAATGQVTLGEIKYNASSQDIKRKGDSSITSGGTKAQRNICRFNRTTTVSSQGGPPSGVIRKRCSYFSSWKELK